MSLNSEHDVGKPGPVHHRRALFNYQRVTDGQLLKTNARRGATEVSCVFSRDLAADRTSNVRTFSTRHDDSFAVWWRWLRNVLKYRPIY